VSGFGFTALALISDCRATVDHTCDRCGGPIAIGDKVVPVQQEVWHHVCFFTPRGTIRAFWRAKPARAKPAPAVDERQIELFGGSK
jgi:hypothetical protein